MQPALDIVNEGLHAIGKTVDTVDSRIKPWAVFNRAGQALFTRHRWSWRTQQTTLYAKADENTVALPDDFAAVTAISIPAGAYQVQLVSRPRIMELRMAPGTNAGSGGSYFVSFDGWTRQANPELLPTPVMDIYPTPVTDDDPTFTLEYQRKWRRIRASDPNGIPNLPDNAEWALVLKCRSMFKALNFEDPGAEEALYESECQRLILEDTPQMNYGRMRGGADEAPCPRTGYDPNVTDVTWS
jgi:hypothetical protein